MKISIVTVVLNRKEYIKRAIENVLSQGYHDFEHIVIDGGSTDGTLDVIKSYNHLKWISEKDSGSVFALNKGLTMISDDSDVFAWLNSDESYLPGVLHKVEDYFLENPSWDVIYGASNYVDYNGKIIGYRKSRSFKLERLIIGINDLAAPSAVFVRYKALKEIGLKVNEKLQHTYDLDLWIRLGVSHKIQNVEDCFSTFAIQYDSGVTKHPMEAIREVDKVTALHKKHLGFLYRNFGPLYSKVYRRLFLLLKWKGIINKSKDAGQ